MADRERYYDQSRDERDGSRQRRPDFDARLDDRTGVEPGSPGGYRVSRAGYGPEDGRYGPPERSGYTEARSFEPRAAYHSEFAAGEPVRRPEHEISDAEYRQRRKFYRGADFGGQPRRAAPVNDLEYRRAVSGAAYSNYLNPYEPWSGIGPSFGFGYDLWPDVPATPDTPRVSGRARGRHLLDKATDDVASVMGDEAAHIRREMDRGEHAGRGPKGYKRSDARIQEDVSDHLTNDSWLDASEIEVSVKDADVTLDGKVVSRDDKRRAELWAESVSGVGHVQNNLRVHHNLHDRDRTLASDSTLARQAKGRA